MKRMHVIAAAGSLMAFAAAAEVDSLAGFWSFKDGTVGTEVETVMSDSGEQTWTGTAYTATSNAGVKPTYSDARPGAIIYAGGSVLCSYPQSLHFALATSGYQCGGYIDIAGLSGSLAGLLCPSKHFGVAHDLGGGLRMQGEMRKAGKAAALAAKLAIEKGVAAKDVPYAELKPLIEKARTPRRPLKTIVTSYHGYAFEPYDDAQVIEELKRDVSRTPEWWFAKSENAPCERSAYAYWTAWKRGMDGKGRPLADALAREMSVGGRFAANFAVALGLMKDARCVPVLRRLVAEPGCEIDPVIEKAIPNRFKAIALLGRFKDDKSVAPLVGIVKDGARGFTRDIAGCRAYESADLYRFQAVSYALMALKSILSAHPDAKVVADLESWRVRPPVIKGYDGADLGARLKKVCFAQKKGRP